MVHLGLTTSWRGKVKDRVMSFEVLGICGVYIIILDEKCQFLKISISSCQNGTKSGLSETSRKVSHRIMSNKNVK